MINQELEFRSGQEPTLWSSVLPISVQDALGFVLVTACSDPERIQCIINPVH
jgi:hypothetical protein